MHSEKQVAIIFAAVSKAPELFPAKPELRHKAAVDIVVVQFKDKSFDLPRLRAIAGSIGRECLTAILETIPTSVTAGLISKLDKANKERASDAGFAVQHALSLAFSEIEPAPPSKVAKVAKPPKRKKEEEPIVRTLHLSKALRKRD